MSRTNQILTAILVVQLVIAAVVLWPRTGPSETSGPLIPEVVAGDVVALTVEDGDGNSVRLVKRSGSWVLPESGDYPAQEATITQLVDKILALSTDRLVTQTASSHKRLQVASDDFVRRLQIETSGGKAHTVYLGSSPQARATHVRLDGQDEVYLAADLASFDASAQAVTYIDATYFSVPVDELVAVAMRNPQGELKFEKDSEGNWSLVGLAAGEVLDANAFTSLRNRVSSVRMTRPLGTEAKAEYGLDSPIAAITLSSSNAGGAEVEVHTLEIGAQDPADNSYVVKSSQSPYYVRVAEFTVQDLVEKTRADFIAEPTPAPEVPAEESSSSP